jgi:hypothetical protein
VYVQARLCHSFCDNLATKVCGRQELFANAEQCCIRPVTEPVNGAAINQGRELTAPAVNQHASRKQLTDHTAHALKLLN